MTSQHVQGNLTGQGIREIVTTCVGQGGEAPVGAHEGVQAAVVARSGGASPGAAAAVHPRPRPRVHLGHYKTGRQAGGLPRSEVR